MQGASGNEAEEQHGVVKKVHEVKKADKATD